MPALYSVGLTYLLIRAVSGPQDVDNVQVPRLFFYEVHRNCPYYSETDKRVHNMGAE